MSFAFCTAGSGEALSTSTHTSFAAARAAARLPAAALLQIPSTLRLVLAASVGSRAMINLQICEYSFTPEASTGLSAWADEVLVGLLVAVVDVVLAGVLAAVVVLAAVAVLASVLVAVEPLVVELPLLPHAAMSTEHSSATASSAVRLPIIDPPWIVRALSHGCCADRAAPDVKTSRVADTAYSLT
jgi:hypothetical protein